MFDAADYAQRDPKTAAIASPVFDHMGLAGALTLLGSRSRFDEARVATMAALLTQQARLLTDRLGGQGQIHRMGQ